MSRKQVLWVTSSIGRAASLQVAGYRFKSDVYPPNYGLLKGIGIPSLLRTRSFSVRVRGNPPYSRRMPRRAQRGLEILGIGNGDGSIPSSSAKYGVLSGKVAVTHPQLQKPAVVRDVRLIGAPPY